MTRSEFLDDVRQRIEALQDRRDELRDELADTQRQIEALESEAEFWADDEGESE